MIYRAILTGDIIGSSRAESRAVEKTITTLADAAQVLSQWAGADTRFTRYRGDGWQLYLDFPGVAFRSCLYLHARLRAANYGLATRISVGVGPTGQTGTSDLSDANGVAFVLSGHGLDHMLRPKRMEIDVMPSKGLERTLGSQYTAADIERLKKAVEAIEGMGKFFKGMYSQADFQCSRWTPEQAEAVALALDPSPPTQEDIAQELGISRQAVQARLKGAGLSALQDTFWAFESQCYPNGETS